MEMIFQNKAFIALLIGVVLSAGCSNTKEAVKPPPMSAGNPANGGPALQTDILQETAYAKEGGRIYYSNPYDNKKLYVMDENLGGRTKLCDDKVLNLNIIGEWIYYTGRMDRTGLFRIKKSGGIPMKVSSDTVGVYVYDGDWIYYSNESDGGKLYRMRPDGASKAKVCDDIVTSALKCDGDFIYYFSFNNFKTDICRIKKDGTGRLVLSKEAPDNFYNFYLEDGWIYYTGSESGIMKLKSDGSQAVNLNTGKATQFYISEGWIYYQNNSDNNNLCRLYRIRTDGRDRLKLNDEFSEFISLAGDWIYYAAGSDGYKLYRIKTDGTGRAKLCDDTPIGIKPGGDWIYYYINGYHGDIVYRIKPDGSGREDIITDETQADKIENTENREEGNTKGNYANMALVAKQGEWTYFSNLSDGAKLYRMKENGSSKTKLCNDAAFYISILDDWIYYIIKPEQGVSNGGMAYKISTDGKSKTPILDTPVSILQIANGWLYITGEHAAGSHMFRIKPDGTEKTALGGLSGQYCIGSGKLYYSQRPDYGIKEATVGEVQDSYDVNTIVLGKAVSFLVDRGWVYYGSGDQGDSNPGLYKIKTNRMGLNRLTVDPPDSFNISGDWIYYTSGQCLYKMKTDGSSRSKLGEGAAGSINMAGDWIYYTDKSPVDAGARLFRIRSGGGGREEIK